MSPYLNFLLKALGVLAILFIIAAILFPILARPTDGGRHPYCGSNMKQIGLALIQYVQDNDEMMPNISDRNGNTWRTAIFPYAKSRQLFQCPDRDQNDSDANPVGVDGFPESYAANYTGNYGKTQPDRGRGAFAGPGSEPLALKDIPDPAQLIALVETAYNPGPDYNIDNATLFSPSSRRLWAGHQGYGNYLMFDGHVKHLRPLDTYHEAYGQIITNLWYRDGIQPLSANGVAVLQDAQQRFSP